MSSKNHNTLCNKHGDGWNDRVYLNAHCFHCISGSRDCPNVKEANFMVEIMPAWLQESLCLFCKHQSSEHRKEGVAWVCKKCSQCAYQI